MTAQASPKSAGSAPHPNARRIALLYTAINVGDLAAIAACYDEDAYFEDIAFERKRKCKIMQMWQFVCHGGTTVEFDANAISADDWTGSGRWTAKYMFGKTDTRCGRPVENAVISSFAFRDGLITEHRDACDPMAWARQALPYPISLVVGSIEPVRRAMAALKLYKFIRTEGPDRILQALKS
jgi:ketosteroid isomerase-like protein